MDLHGFRHSPICYLQRMPEEETLLPKWLSNQIMRAFHKRDRRQIVLLNDCWFFYYNRQGANNESSNLQ